MTNMVCACLDGHANAGAVLDGAVWAAQRLAVPLRLHHALEPTPDPAALADYSGAIGVGAQEHLLDELAALDARRAGLARAAGMSLLEGARERASVALGRPVELHLCHGELTETVVEMQSVVGLFVLGERFRPERSAGRLHLDHHVERVVRGVSRPGLVVPGARFSRPAWAAIAFDGSEPARTLVERVAGSPLLKGLPLMLVTAGSAGNDLLAAPAARLREAGCAVDPAVLPSTPEVALPALMDSRPDGLLVMGAYGHSRIREFILGSTTTTILRHAKAPTLILR
jgi:nucleotide-binding universal stress UspA family protein